MGKGLTKGEDLFFIFYTFFAFHFKETTETFSGSTKMEIFTGKMLKSRREKTGKVTSPLKIYLLRP